MNETITDDPTATPRASGTSGCCARPTATTAVLPHPADTAASPCCGTAREAQTADSCCGAAAKAEAVASGAGCCS